MVSCEQAYPPCHPLKGVVGPLALLPVATMLPSPWPVKRSTAVPPLMSEAMFLATTSASPWAKTPAFGRGLPSASGMETVGDALLLQQLLHRA